MEQRRSLLLPGLTLALIAVAIGTRVVNAFQYPAGWGFDALGNWDYVEQLTRSWALPSPEAGWSAAHPPLFYYMSAALLRVTDSMAMEKAFPLLRLVGAGLGLGVAGLGGLLVARLDPGNRRRAVLAAGLVLFLPAHVYMSAMLSEEMLTAFLSSLVIVGVTLSLASPASARTELTRALGIGVTGGLALMTKLSGATAALTAAGAYAWNGARRRAWRVGLSRAATVLVVTVVVGGWYYARNWSRYGELYPHGLVPHRIMYQMPPGERELADYLRLPLATWTDPQLLQPDLLRSVWGSTYATLWFDGHRHFLPRSGTDVQRAGTLLLVLALLPTLAFLAGLASGIRRTFRSRGDADATLISFVVLTLAGYVVFTWRNPWFATLKGSYLLVLSVPFAFYASESLDRWSRKGALAAACVWGALGLLAVAVTAVFTYGLVFTKSDPVGLPWRPGF